MDNYKVYPDWVAEKLGVSRETVIQYRSRGYFDFPVYCLTATGNTSRIKFIKLDEFEVWFEKHLIQSVS